MRIRLLFRHARQGLFLAVALSIVMPAQAQDRLPGARRSSVPDSVLSPRAVELDFRNWSLANVGDRGIWHASQAGLRVTIAVLDATSRLHRAAEVRSVLIACASPATFSPATAERAAAGLPWSAFDSATSSVPLLTVTVTAARERSAGCVATHPIRYAGVSEGVWPLVEPTQSAPPDIADVEFIVDSQSVAPRLAGAVHSRTLRGDSIVSGQSQVRFYLDIDAIAPRLDGSLPSVAIRTLAVNSPITRLVTVPDSVVTRLWIEAQRWRAATAQAGGRAAADIPLPLLTDPTLRRAREHQLAGARDSAVLIATSALHRGSGLVDQDIVIANLQLGFLQVASGDDVSAHGHLSRALHLEPCIQLPEATDARYVVALDRARPAADCASRPLRSSLRAALIPGGVQRARPGQSRRIGNVLLAATIASLAAGMYDRSRAESFYDKYESELLDPPGVYRRAEQHRVRSVTLLSLGSALWIGSAVIGIASEHRRGVDLLDRRDFGARPTSAFGAVEPRPEATP